MDQKMQTIEELYEWSRTKVWLTDQFRVLFYRERALGATVALLVNDGKLVMARGVSICSPRDQLSKNKGRVWALKAAIDAIENGDNVRRILSLKYVSVSDEVSAIRYAAANSLFGFHSAYKPDLTFKEKQLMKNEKSSIQKIDLGGHNNGDSPTSNDHMSPMSKREVKNEWSKNNTSEF